jgi:hypothetical protein
MTVEYNGFRLGAEEREAPSRLQISWLPNDYQGNSRAEDRSSAVASHKKILLERRAQGGTCQKHLLFRSVSCDRIKPALSQYSASKSFVRAADYECLGT